MKEAITFSIEIIYFIKYFIKLLYIKDKKIFFMIVHNI